MRRPLNFEKQPSVSLPSASLPSASGLPWGKPPKKRGAYDFETWEWVNPICCGFAWGEPNAREHHYILDSSHKRPQDVARAALVYMSLRTDIDTWWAYNGGRFDVQILLVAAVDMGWKVDAIVTGGRAIKVTFRSEDGARVVCCDNIAMMASPKKLSACAKEFQLPSSKLFTEEDYKQDTRTWERERLRKGCLIDCDLVLEHLEVLEALVTAWGGAIRTTFSSTALTMVQHDLHENSLPFPEIADTKVNQWCREGYYGGRVEVIHHAPQGELIELDVCSSYPWSMAQPLPWKYLGRATTPRGMERMLSGERAGVIEAEVDVPEMAIPPLPFRPRKGGIYFPTGRWVGQWPANELAYARTLGVKVTPLEGHAFDVQEPFAAFINRVYEVKQTAPKGALRAFAKDTLNGCYGKWGQSPEREKLHIVHDEDAAHEYILAAMPGTVGQLSDDPRFLIRKNIIWAWHTHYALAAYVTAYSRIKLHQAMLACEGLAYVDTDCTHSRTSSTPRGSELGAWKLEAEGYRAKFWAPKVYELHHAGGESTYAAKGFTLRDAEQFARLVKGELLELGSRNVLIKTQCRKSGKLSRTSDKKQWSGRSRKRCPLPDGKTRPWRYTEIIGGVHELAMSPNF